MENQYLDENLMRSQTTEIDLEPVSGGRRFANYIIDTIIWYILLMVVMGFFMFNDEGLADDLVSESGRGKGWSYLFTYSTMIVYYWLMETLTKGRTIGKFITGTRAVRSGTGEPISGSDAIKRTLCRIVPFEAFSFLGGYAIGWHDRWTDTLVISEKDFQSYNY